MTSSTEQRDERELVSALAAPLHRIVRARVGDPHLVDDVVQETLLKVLGARDRIADDALLPYAVVTARNLVTSGARRDATAQRNAADLMDLAPPPPDPEEAFLRTEENEALGVALRALPARDRDALVAHEVHGVDTRTLAGSGSSTPGGVAAQLARTRARLRVEYLLALRRVDLPLRSCKPVLLALSAGDKRRQRALDTGSHLLTCDTCAALSEPLLARKRVLAGILPAGVVAWLAGFKPSSLGAGSLAQLAAGTAATGVAATALVIAVTADDPPPTLPPPEPPPVLGPGYPGVTGAELAAAARDGRQIRADAAEVLMVGADEGFWIANNGQRLWVQLTGRGESRFQVRTGQQLSFSALPVAHSTGFADQIGLNAGDGARALDRQRLHFRVSAAELRRAGAGQR